MSFYHHFSMKQSIVKVWKIQIIWRPAEVSIGCLSGEVICRHPNNDPLFPMQIRSTNWLIVEDNRVKIIPWSTVYLKHHLTARITLVEVDSMLIQRLVVKFGTCVKVIENILSFVQMEQFLTRNLVYVTGGIMLTVLSLPWRSWGQVRQLFVQADQIQWACLTLYLWKEDWPTSEEPKRQNSNRFGLVNISLQCNHQNAFINYYANCRLSTNFRVFVIHHKMLNFSIQLKVFFYQNLLESRTLYNLDYQSVSFYLDFVDSKVISRILSSWLPFFINIFYKSYSSIFFTKKYTVHPPQSSHQLIIHTSKFHHLLYTVNSECLGS